MENFKSFLAGFWATGLAPCPLLFATGAAFTAAGVYYYMKKGPERNVDVEELVLPAQFSRALENMEGFNLEERVRALEDLLLDSHKECERKNEECERERDAKSVLQSEYDQMKETASVKKKTLMVTLAQAERRSEQLEEANYHLQNYIIQLTEDKDKLQQSLLKLKKERAVIPQECERELEAYSVLKSRYKVTLKQCVDLQKECEREQDTKSVLQSEYDQMKETASVKEETLMVTLAQAERRLEQLEEANCHLQNYIIQLTEDKDTLQQSLLKLKKEKAAIAQECERERKVNRVLRSHYDQMKESFE